MNRPYIISARKTAMTALLAAVALAVFCVFLEFGARALSGFSPLPGEVSSGSVYKEDSVLAMFNWGRDYRAHPYFGYVHPEDDRLLADIKNKSGRFQNKFIAVILGGSVAENFFRGVESGFAERLKQAVPALREKDIVAVNLAIGAGMQPRQFFITSYLLDSVDLILNIDGFNELGIVKEQTVLPPEYPTFSLRFFYKDLGNAWLRRSANSVRAAYTGLTDLPDRLPFLANSHAFYRLWNLSRNFSSNAVYRLEDAYLKNVNGFSSNISRLAEARAAAWGKYTRLSFLAAKSRSTKYFSFVQPNQYLRNSKSFTPEEKLIAFNSRLENELPPVMDALFAEAERLRKDGVPVLNLMNIFSSVEEPIYIDNCCHFNERGNKILADAVFSAIAREW